MWLLIKQKVLSVAYECRLQNPRSLTRASNFFEVSSRPLALSSLSCCLVGSKREHQAQLFLFFVMVPNGVCFPWCRMNVNAELSDFVKNTLGRRHAVSDSVIIMRVLTKIGSEGLFSLWWLARLRMLFLLPCPDSQAIEERDVVRYRNATQHQLCSNSIWQ